MTYNFSVIDFFSAILAFLLYFPILFIPGYVIGWFSNACGFRNHHLLFRSIISIALSTSTLPVIIYLISRFLPNSALWLFWGFFVVAFFILLYLTVDSAEISTFFSSLKYNKMLLSLILLLVCITLLTMIDFSYDHKSYLSVENYDYTTRTAIISAITRTGVPPANPFFYPGFPIKLSYHYFWLLICSLAERMSAGAITPRAALFGSTVWAGLALISVILVYQKVIKAKSSQDLRSISLISVGLLFVTGLDIIMVLLYYLFIALIIPEKLVYYIYPTIEWWNEQITGWLDAIVWVPHHIVALVACLMCLIIFQSIDEYSDSRSIKFVLIFLCALCCSSAIGLSIFVSFIFIIALSIWFFWSVIVKNYKQVYYLLLIGLFILILSLPFLQELTSTSNAVAAPISLGIRIFNPVQVVAVMFGVNNPILFNTINLLFLPLNYFIELGAFSAIAYLYWKGNLSFNRINRPQLLEIIVLATSVVVCTFVRSNVTGGNDLGWRGFMFAQFFLLIWAADYLNNLYTHHRDIKIIYRKLGIVGPMIIIGISSTIFDITMLRCYTIFMDSHAMVNNQHVHLGKRNYAIRQAYTFIDSTFPKDAIIQHNPDTVINFGGYSIPFEFYNGLYGNRQVILADKGQAIGFAGIVNNLPEITSSISAIFSPETKDVHNVAAICAKYSISALLVRDTDGLWGAKDSWMWRLKPVFDNGYVKVFNFKEE